MKLYLFFRLTALGLLLNLCFFCTDVKAQVYCYTQTTTTYTDLASPISLNNGVIWDDTIFFVPIGFDFTYFGNTYDSLALSTNGILYPYDSLSQYDLSLPLMPFGGRDTTTDLIDRGFGSGTSASSIGYEISGSVGSRILKIEVKNAGFKLKVPTLSEYVNFQVWLYEGTNTVEFIIGSTNADASCFDGATGPSIGIGNTTSKRGYYLSGDPNATVLIDTISLLNNTPVSGSMYSFTPSLLEPEVSILSDVNPPCASAAITFTASPVNGGTPFYEWRRNDTIVGTNSNTYSQALFNEGDEIRCFMKSSLVCSNSLPVTSNRIFTLEPLAEITIFTDTTTVCGNATLSFSAFSQNEGPTPSYQWKKNGLDVGLDDSQYEYTSPVTSDTIQCILTSDEFCVVGNPAASNKIGLIVITPLVPGIGITADKDSICSGEPITFTAAIANGGITPEFIWYKNGFAQDSSGYQFVDSTFAQGDTVLCQLVSALSCITADTVSSAKLTVLVKPQVQPDITISTGSTTVCSILSTAFSSTNSNGGASPVYQWKINNSNAGTNIDSFNYTGFSDQDTVYCIVTSSLLCGAKDTSNKIVLTVLPALTPSITITADKDSVCSGGSISFSTTTTNGGNIPAYEWRINNVTTGITSSSYNTSALVDGEIVSCVLTTSETCVTQASIASNTITARIVPYSNATISISSSQTTACNTTTINFTSLASATGNTPVYQWRKNSTIVGTNSPTLSMAGFNDNDQVTCRLTSSLFCVTNSPATSNSIDLEIIPTTTAAVTISADQNPVCTGGKVKFTASVLGATTPIYQWKLNNISVGISNPIFTLTNIADNDQIVCELTNLLTCSGVTPLSNTITMGINASLDPTVSIVADKTSICTPDTVTFTASVTNPGTSPVYQWKKNGVNVGTNSNQYQVKNLSNNDAVVCEFSNANNCLANSNTISVSVSTCLSTLTESEIESLSIYPNPFEDYLTIHFKAEKETVLSIVDILGREVFESSIPENEFYETTIPTASLLQGVYSVRLFNDQGFYSEKYIKLK